jgi:hypothetical protein
MPRAAGLGRSNNQPLGKARAPGFRTPECRNPITRSGAGVGKAPRHEIAGR